MSEKTASFLGYSSLKPVQKGHNIISQRKRCVLCFTNRVRKKPLLFLSSHCFWYTPLKRIRTFTGNSDKSSESFNGISSKPRQKTSLLLACLHVCWSWMSLTVRYKYASYIPLERVGYRDRHIIPFFPLIILFFDSHEWFLLFFKIEPNIL